MSSSWGHASMMKFDADNITEYGYLTMSGNQTTGLSADDPVQFDQREGNIKFDSGTYRVTLKADITYKLHADILVGFAGNTGTIHYAWYDVTNSQELGKPGWSQANSKDSDSTAEVDCTAVTTPLTDVNVELRIIALTGSAVTAIYETYARATITTIGTLRGFGPAKDYAYLSMSGDQTADLGVDDSVQFDQSEGSIQFNGSTYKATLKAGVTYRLHSNILIGADGSSQLTYNWYDVTNSAALGAKGISVSATFTGNNSNNIALAIVTPSTDIEVELRIITNSSVTSIYGDYSSAIIEALESVIPENRNSNLVSQEIAKEYGFLIMSENQTTDLTADNAIKFDQREGSIGFNAGSYKATLKAGVTYRLQASLYASYSAGGYLTYKWWDITNSQQLGIQGTTIATTYSGNVSGDVICDAVVTPTTDIEVELRIHSVASLSNITATQSSAYIESIDTVISTVKHRDNNPTGVIITKVDSNVPDGYFHCNGQAVSRTAYSDLFATIGETYGNGDASTTYNVPDYRGYFLRGWDAAAGADPDAASRTDRGDGTTGDYVGTKQADEFEEHYHGYWRELNGTTGSTRYTPGGNDDLRNTNGEGGNETRPQNINVMYCIKY